MQQCDGGTGKLKLSAYSGGVYQSLKLLNGHLSADAYSTAWVALVPDCRDLNRPAWPQALDYLRANQLDDGGWGACEVYYAHERTISTLAAVWALKSWSTSKEDRARIRRGLKALKGYVRDIALEDHEPVGFELVVPRLISELVKLFGEDFPLFDWKAIMARGREKLALIGTLHIDSTAPRSWWFSMEMLPERRLAELSDSVLEMNGSIVTSVTSTAAYLRAIRRSGRDSDTAACYLDNVVRLGEGGASFCWPAEVFVQVWALDSLRRAEVSPSEPSVMQIARRIRRAWDWGEPGLSSSRLFRVNDGDDTLVGFTVLNWTGMQVPDDGMLAFWDKDHFKSYKDERHASISANIHGLTALRTQVGFPHRDLAIVLTDWLIEHLGPELTFNDKWHVSSLYSISHAIEAFAGWHNEVALRCVSRLISMQHTDGGWGGFGQSTQEETAHCALGLLAAFRNGLLDDTASLDRARDYLKARTSRRADESLWIGKTLFRPRGVVETVVSAARVAMEQVDEARLRKVS